MLDRDGKIAGHRLNPLAYRWTREPVIEQHLFGCAGRWNAKTHTCKGGWVPLQPQLGP